MGLKLLNPFEILLLKLILIEKLKLFITTGDDGFYEFIAKNSADTATPGGSLFADRSGISDQMLACRTSGARDAGIPHA